MGPLKGLDSMMVVYMDPLNTNIPSNPHDPKPLNPNPKPSHAFTNSDIARPSLRGSP